MNNSIKTNESFLIKLSKEMYELRFIVYLVCLLLTIALFFCLYLPNTQYSNKEDGTVLLKDTSINAFSIQSWFYNDITKYSFTVSLVIFCVLLLTLYNNIIDTFFNLTHVLTSFFTLTLIWFFVFIPILVTVHSPIVLNFFAIVPSVYVLLLMVMLSIFYDKNKVSDE